MVLQISEINIIKHESSDMSFDENKEGLISCALQFNLIWNNKQGIPVTILLYIYIYQVQKRSLSSVETPPDVT